MQTSGHETEMKVRVRRNPKGFFRKLVLLVIAIYVVFVSYRFINGLIITRLAEVQQVSEGVIQSTVPASGIFVRNEKVVYAPKTGKLKVIIPEGERVRVGETVAQAVAPSLKSKTGEALFNITAPRAGIVSYRLDGLEDVYSPAKISELDLSKVQTIENELRKTMAGGQVEEGKPVLRIVSNLEPIYIIGTISGNPASLGGDEAKSILVSFAPDEKVSHALILEKGFREQADTFLLSLSDYPDKLLTGRRHDFWIVTERFEGYYVPVSAIVRKDGKDGIYTVYKERVKWKSVEIKGQADEKVAISGVTSVTKVILNPEYVKEGFPLKTP